MSEKIGVLGAGSFGTALALHAAGSGHEAFLWARREELAVELRERGENAQYLPGVPLGDAVRVTADLDDLASCDLVIVAVPSHGFRAVLKQFVGVATSPSIDVVSATKGIEGDSLARMSQVCFEEAIQADRDLRFSVLSGPSFAAEMARGVPTAAVIASDDSDLAESVQQRLSGRALRLYTSADVTGVELGGTCKNVVAIASGALSGLGFGHNTLAALITRGLHEMTRLGLAYGGQPRTFSGLAGLGDLVLTCTGGLSRNRRAGLALAEGKSLADLELGEGMVAEGIKNSLAVVRLAERRGVEMPIAEMMVEVIHRGKAPRQAVEDLMLRELKAEAEL